MQAPGFREAESKFFWQVSGELLHALRDDAPAHEISDLFDEVESLALYAESDNIRKRCCELLRRRPRPAGLVG